MTQQAAAYDIDPVMRLEYGLELPPGLVADFAHALSTRGGLVPPAQLQVIFEREYLVRVPAPVLLLRCAADAEWATMMRAALRLRRQELIRWPHADPAVACSERLRSAGIHVTVLDRYSHYVGRARQTAVYIRCLAGTPVWGAGISRDAIAASRHAVLAAVARSKCQ